MRKAFERTGKIIKTRGFWTVQVVWFAAGGIFFQLLPTRDFNQGWFNMALNGVLLTIILAPIYWTLVLDFSDAFNRLIDKLLERFKI